MSIGFARTGRLAAAIVVILPLAPAAAHAQKPGMRLAPISAVQLTTAQLMSMKSPADPALIAQARMNWEPEIPDRSGLPQAPGAARLSRWPIQLSGATQTGLTQWRPQPFAPQSLGISFTAATLAQTGAFPPDCEGAVGPTQYVLFVNGRIRSFDKTSGASDGVLDVPPDAFFSTVMTPLVNNIVLNFTSDPQVRYDRLSARWFMSIIDVPCRDSHCAHAFGNRWLLAVSDAASAGTITASTVWSLFFFQTDPVNFLDYPSLGVDDDALYMGGDMFDSTLTQYLGTNGYVVNKASVTSGGPMVVTEFAGMAQTGVLEGPQSPRGVDNDDPLSSEGYFIGNNTASLGSLVVRRIGDPGGTPTISPNLLLTVNATAQPIPVAHLGNTGGNSGRLDAIDDRLFAAHIKNGRLWTAHTIGVDASGIASGPTGGSVTRDAVRWYELSGIRSADNGGVPLVVQSGTVFDTAATVATARQYWMPSAMVSGQGHAALGFSTAGTTFHADAATCGRLTGDPLGATQAVNIYTSSSTAYNPSSDTGALIGARRWGDYSLTTLDPLDDMTMWTIQEFCDVTNSYGCRAVKLMAPPPATPASAPPVVVGRASNIVLVTGNAISGSGFFDPGPDLAAPALPYHHLSALVTNTDVTGNPPAVNSATYIDPTHIQLDLNTLAADISQPGQKYDVVVKNPDGQIVAGSNVLEVEAPTTAVGTDASVFRLESVAPNPTTGATHIAFDVAYAVNVRLGVVDVQGREIAVLADGALSAGRHEALWDGLSGGARAPAGIYFIRYRAAGFQQVRRLVIKR